MGRLGDCGTSLKQVIWSASKYHILLKSFQRLVSKELEARGLIAPPLIASTGRGLDVDLKDDAVIILKLLTGLNLPFMKRQFRGEASGSVSRVQSQEARI